MHSEYPSGAEPQWAWVRRVCGAIRCALHQLAGKHVEFTIGDRITLQNLRSGLSVPARILASGHGKVVLVASRAVTPQTEIVLVKTPKAFRGRTQYCIGWGAGYRITALLS